MKHLTGTDEVTEAHCMFGLLSEWSYQCIHTTETESDKVRCRCLWVAIAESLDYSKVTV